MATIPEPSIEVLRFYASSPVDNHMRRMARLLLLALRKKQEKE